MELVWGAAATCEVVPRDKQVRTLLTLYWIMWCVTLPTIFLNLYKHDHDETTMTFFLQFSLNNFSPPKQDFDKTIKYKRKQILKLHLLTF